MSGVKTVLCSVGSVTFFTESSPDRLDLYARVEGDLAQGQQRQIGASLMFEEVDSFKERVGYAVAAASGERVMAKDPLERSVQKLLDQGDAVGALAMLLDAGGFKVWTHKARCRIWRGKGEKCSIGCRP